MNEVVKVIVHKAKVVAIGVVEAAERERIGKICEAEGVQLKKAKVKAAEALADDMEPEMVTLKEQSLKRKLDNAGMSGLGKDLGPNQALELCKKKLATGHDVQDILELRMSMVYFDTRRSTLKATASALRNLHGFAVHIRGYHPERTLPPGMRLTWESG